MLINSPSDNKTSQNFEVDFDSIGRENVTNAFMKMEEENTMDLIDYKMDLQITPIVQVSKQTLRIPGQQKNPGQLRQMDR